MALGGALKNFMDDLADVSAELEANAFITNAKKSIEDQMHNFEISDEEKAKLFSNYVQQISLGLLSQAVDIVKTAPASKYIEEKAKYDKFASEASLRKQYGYEIDADGKLVDKNDGMIDEQTEGFRYDSFYKILSAIGQENQMLVQNDQAVKEWQVDIYKMAVEALSRGKIDITTTGTGDTRETTVEWKGNATKPDGI